MDVSQKIDAQTKARLVNLSVECQVLQNLLNEKNAKSQEVIKEILTSLTPNPAMYGLKINPSKDIWELELRPGALVIPGVSQGMNRAARRAIGKN